MMSCSLDLLTSVLRQPSNKQFYLYLSDREVSEWGLKHHSKNTSFCCSKALYLFFCYCGWHVAHQTQCYNIRRGI